MIIYTRFFVSSFWSSHRQMFRELFKWYFDSNLFVCVRRIEHLQREVFFFYFFLFKKKNQLIFVSICLSFAIYIYKSIWNSVWIELNPAMMASSSTTALLKKGKRGAAKYVHQSCLHASSPHHLQELLDLILNPCKTINEWEAIDWLKWLMAGGSTPDEFASLGKCHSHRLSSLVSPSDISCSLLFLSFPISLLPFKKNKIKNKNFLLLIILRYKIYLYLPA